MIFCPNCSHPISVLDGCGCRCDNCFSIITFPLFGSFVTRRIEMTSEEITKLAESIVANRQYKEIIDAIIAHGGDLSSLVSAVNKHRYITIAIDE